MWAQQIEIHAKMELKPARLTNQFWSGKYKAQ